MSYELDNVAGNIGIKRTAPAYPTAQPGGEAAGSQAVKRKPSSKCRSDEAKSS